MKTYVLSITLEILHYAVSSDIGHLYRLIILTKFESETS
jgi:hypothetical protein